MVKHDGERPREMKKAGILVLFWLVAGCATAQASPAPVSDWVETGRVEFHGTDGYFRSQGVASDGNSLFFSWNLGLIRTAIDAPSVPLVDKSTSAIPDDLDESGHNHIGDIDVADGILYAPIEDGPAYEEPWVVLYDAETLEPTGDRYLLPVTVQRDGVPWIAVDQARGVAYSMEWNDTGTLFVYRLGDFELIDTVTLSEKVPRIQGAKIFRGNLYASRDNGTEKSIVAIDPENGQVTHLFDRNLGDDYEAEGIAFIRRSSGTEMVATGIREGGSGYTEMRTYRIGGDVTPPVLSSLSFRPARVRKGAKPSLRLTVSEPVTASLSWLRCVGPPKKPCGKKKSSGPSRKLTLETGTTRVALSPRSVGHWQVAVVPTDRADIVGTRKAAGLTVLRPRR